MSSRENRKSSGSGSKAIENQGSKEKARTDNENYDEEATRVNTRVDIRGGSTKKRQKESPDRLRDGR